MSYTYQRVVPYISPLLPSLTSAIHYSQLLKTQILHFGRIGSEVCTRVPPCLWTPVFIFCLDVQEVRELLSSWAENEK